MSEIEVFDGDSYTIIAWYHHHKLLDYVQFGSYQGEWVMFSRSEAGDYYLWQGYYGSCGGCDSFQAHFDYNDAIIRQQAAEFCEGYHPFLVLDAATMLNACLSGGLKELMPKNNRDFYGDVDYDALIPEIVLAVKLEEGWSVTKEDVLNATNLELQQRALARFGIERLIEETDAEVVQQRGEEQLIRIGGLMFAFVVDPSSGRRYPLQVPNTCLSLRSAVAWTFGLREDQYHPIFET